MKRMHMAAIALVLAFAGSQINAATRPQKRFAEAIETLQNLKNQAAEVGVMSGSFYEEKEVAIKKAFNAYLPAMNELKAELNELERQKREYGVMSGSFFEAVNEVKGKIQKLKTQMIEFVIE